MELTPEQKRLYIDYSNAGLVYRKDAVGFRAFVPWANNPTPLCVAVCAVVGSHVPKSLPFPPLTWD